MVKYFKIQWLWTNHCFFVWISIFLITEKTAIYDEACNLFLRFLLKNDIILSV